MKNKLVWDDAIEEVDLGDGDYISIATSVSVKTMMEIGAAPTQVEASMSMLRQLIKSWRGPSFEKNGEPVPCNPENIDRLDISVANELATRLGEIVSGQNMDDETKNESIESSSST